jgi:hypothetical protein
MFARQGFVTNSSSSSFLVWLRDGEVTPELVVKWGILKKIAKHIKNKNWDKRVKLDFSPENIANRINGFKYELPAGWADKQIARHLAWVAGQKAKIKNPPAEDLDLPKERQKIVRDFRKRVLKDEGERLAEYQFTKSLQDQGYKVYAYFCEDLLGWERNKPYPLGLDRSEVGICIHLTLHEDGYHHNKSHQAVFNDTEEGGIRGVVYYLWPND